MERKRRIRLAAKIVLAVCAVQLLRAEAALRWLDVERQRDSWRLNPAQRLASAERRMRLEELWWARGERSVAAEVLPFLRDATVGNRTRAVEILGRLEDPAGAVALRSLQRQAGLSQSVDGIPTFKVRMALARIRARRRPALLRVAALAGSLGLPLMALPVLPARYARWPRCCDGPVHATPDIEWELVDLLHQIGKERKRAPGFARWLNLNPQQRLVVSCGALSEQEEIGYLVDWLSRKRVMTGEDARVVEFLAQRGPAIVPVVVRRLEAMRKNPQGQAYMGYAALFRALQPVGGHKAAAVVASFRKHSDVRVTYYANQAYERMVGSQWTPKKAKTLRTMYYERYF